MDLRDGRVDVGGNSARRILSRWAGDAVTKARRGGERRGLTDGPEQTRNTHTRTHRKENILN